ncbi:hypothetical protein B0H34DRAFT_700699 [Crassisporium funariophilum]|nr:hypothetical protein B0H34DRAFT_700699 [Crassisporium funariophilum]
MRAACDIYEHPELSDSEIWAKDAYNSSGKARLFSVLAALSVVMTVTTFAVCHYTGLLDVRSLQSTALLRALL